MKVGLISFHSFYRPGGVKRHVFGLQKEFQKRGIETKIIAPRRNSLEDYGQDVILLGTSFPFNVNGTQTDLCVNFNPLAIEKTLKREKFDVLHFHNFGLPSAFQILERSQSLNILTFHAQIEKNNLFKKIPGFLGLLVRIGGLKMHGIIGVAPLNLKIFKNFKGPKAVIPNGIDLEEFNSDVPKIEKFLDGKINLLFVGRIEKRKGLIYLFKAYQILAKKFSNLRLIVVGEGKLKESCQKWAKDNNLQEIYFEGQVLQEQLPSYFNTADIFISPAIFGESFGLVLLEAMACSVPVAAFANQGYSRLLKGKKGEMFLVPPKNYKALAKKMEVLIQDSSLRKSMGEWGRKEAQKYAWPKIADQILAFYKLCQKTKQ